MCEEGRLADPRLPAHQDEAPARIFLDPGKRGFEGLELLAALDEAKGLWCIHPRYDCHANIIPGSRKGCNPCPGMMSA